MKYRRMLAAAAALGVSFGVAAVLASPAQAAPEQAVCATWKAQGAAGEYPAILFGDKPAGTVISTTSAKLVKPTAGKMPGVEFAAFDLDLTGPFEVKVSYELNDGASSSAGAIRMFGYSAKSANTVTVGPDYGPAIADGTDGVLKFSVPEGKKLGTLGLVYDGSNEAKGWVTFSNMKVDGRLVSFTPCPTPKPTTPKPTQSSFGPTDQPTPPTDDPTPPTEEPTPEETVEPPVAGPTLPVTGPGSPVLAVGAGLGVVLAGIVLVVLARRRKNNFSA